MTARTSSLNIVNLALGDDPERYAIYLDENSDSLDGMVSLVREELWENVGRDDTELLGRLCEAFTDYQDQNNTEQRVIESLKHLLDQDMTWTHPGTVDMLLARAKRVNQGAEQDIWLYAVSKAIDKSLDSDKSPAALNTLDSLLKHLDRLDSKKSHDNPMTLLVCSLVAPDSRADKEGLIVIQTLLKNGCSLEYPVVLDYLDNPKEKLANPLHLACHYHDRLGGGEGAINLLINMGADVERVLKHRNAPTGRSLDVIERHPKMRAKALTALATKKRNSRPGARSL